MAAQSVTAEDIRQPEAPLTCLTCYDYLTARVMDEVTSLDMILVGDTLGMVALGYEDTLPVTLQDMIHHTAAVSRGVNRAFLVADLPFLQMAQSRDRSVNAVRRLVQEGGADAVKIEGGEENARTIGHLVDHGVPVIGHLGLTPQSVKAMGGYKVQANDPQQIRDLGRDARSLEQAGVLAVVLECVPAPVARHLTRMLSVPTIGIGAGKGCSGQVLVWQDMMGLTEDSPPTFVRQWDHLDERLREGTESFCEAVREGRFPDESESYSLPEELDESKVAQWLRST